MSTQFTNRQWRLPNEENKSKQSNYSLSFDGSSQYINAGVISALSNVSEYSISLWANIDTGASGTLRLFGNRESSSPYNGIGLDIDLSASLYFYLNGGPSYPVVQVSNISNYITAGTWFHIVCTFNAGQAYIFIDGVQRGSGTGGSTADTTTNPLYIGADPINTGSYFDGFIDALAIYNYELSSSQITTLYGSSSTGIGNPMSLSPAPVAYYPLGDQDSFNGAEYLTPNASLKDFVFDFENSSNQYISGTALLPNTDYTISAWINLETVTTESILSWGEDATGKRRALFIWNGGAGAYRLYSSTYGSNIGGSTTLLTGQWYHAAVTVSSAAVAKIYLNGSLDGTGTNTLNSFTGNNFYIGRTPSGEYFDGKISNAQIFNTVLPATGSNSIETLYNNGSPLTSMSGFTSLQGWWKLDASATYDGTDWSIPDDSSNSNTGTSSGMTQSALQQSDLSFKTSFSPYALNFDGTDDYIDCGTTVQQPTTNYSVSYWVKFDSVVGNVGIVGNFKTGVNPQVGFALTLSSGPNFQFWADGTANTNGGLVTGTSTPNSSTWYNVVGTYDGSLVKIYVNNVLENSVSYSATPNVTDQNLVIGRWYGNYSDYYTGGSISNVSVWNAALTSTQVTEIYSEGIPQNLNNHSAYSNLVSWWQLGSNSSFSTNWTVLDEVTASGNNGTSANMTESDIVDGVNSYANGLSNGMGGDEVIGDAPYSSSNSLSVNMDVLDRTEDTPS